MNEEQLQQLTSQLAEIELPPEPDWWPWLVALLVLIIILLVAGFILWRRGKKEKSVAAEALQRLAQLEREWCDGALDARRCAYQLATLLRLGLKLPQLDHNAPPQLADQQGAWLNTITLLQRLRYPAGSQTQLTHETFATIRTWLTQADSAC